MTVNYLPDVYRISDTVQEIQKRYIEEDDTTLMMGIYGYLAEINTNVLQNSIFLASEYGNEALATRSKFERTILTNAITYDIDGINATPAKMTVMLGFIKSNLDEYLNNNKEFILDRYSLLALEKYNFHLDYDLIIRRNKLLNNNIVYSAKYDMSFENKISDITNPYLQSPIISNIQGDEYLFVICDIRQTSLDVMNHKVITNNILESKTFDFDFENQLCNFNIFITENGVKTELTPVYEGMPYDKDNYYCYYTYMDDNTIRVKFDRKSYQPALNCTIDVEVYTTLGSDGNFTYNDLTLLPLESDRFDYKNIKTIIKPMSSSVGGINRKTTNELQRIIPKRMLSRGGIINTKDLQNYFDMIDVNNRLVVYKKRDNQIQRLYYAYLLAKDNSSNIVPSNSIDIKIAYDDIDSNYDDRYTLKPGRPIYYDKNMVGYYKKDIIKNNEHLEECDSGCGCLVGERHPLFTYTSPFITIINKNPLSISYYLDLINREYVFGYDYINQKSVLQFVSTTISMYKNYLSSEDYIFTMNVTQNISTDKGVVTYIKDEEGNDTEEIDKINLKPVLAVQSGKSKYYVIGEVISYDDRMYTYTLEFKISSDNSMINKQNQIKITNLIKNTMDTPQDYFIDDKVNISVYMYLDKCVGDLSEDEGYSEDINVPTLAKDFILVNKYIIKEDVHLFYNYSSTINSVCKVLGVSETPVPEDAGFDFKLFSIPLIRYDYLNDEQRLNEFIEYIQYRKTYIDMAQRVLEDSFNIDLKFFNTYGPSKLFRIGRQSEELDRVNLTLDFIVKLDVISNTEVIYNIKDSIKEYIEDINTLSSIHISNLCSHIRQTYNSDISYIEFTGINTYNSNYQYIERKEPDILTEVPEFVNINLNDDMEADINITVI